MTRIYRPGLLIAMSAALLSAGCGGDDGGPTGLDPNEFELVRFAGNGQVGLAGTVLFEPIAVMVRARDTGTPEEGVIVSWEITAGNASPTRATSATDSDGIASTRIQLGGTASDVQVEARVTGLPSVGFALESEPAPSLESVSPGSADPGDVVDVTVRDLPDAVATEVLFDGIAAEVVEVVPGDPATLRAVVPPPAGACDGNAQSVAVRLRAGQITSDPVSIQVTVPAEPFQVGRVLVMGTTSQLECAVLPAAGGTAEYLLVALSALFEEPGNVQVTLGGSNVAISSSAARGRQDPGDFHTGLRLLEHDLASRDLPAARSVTGDAALFAEPEVGSSREFWVLNNTDQLNLNNLTEGDFDRIRATLRFKGAHTLLYVDDDAPTGGLTQEDIDFFGDLYDRRLYDVDVDFFGAPTDVDDNDRVVVLLSPVVNGLTEEGADGVVVGFFFALDLFSADLDPSTCPPCQFSNESEVFYGLVPDPEGTFSDVRETEFVRRLLPGVMVHETQHMINFRYKFFEHSTTPELLWLSEGLAHMAEELAGDEIDAAGQPELADELYIPNFGRALRYLDGPDTVSLTATGGQGTLAERGAAWIFLRWIADQYGDFIFRPLTQARESGVDNVRARTDESFFRLFADWSVAMWADDLAIEGLSERYQVPKWRLRDIIRVDPEGGGDPVYALQPLQRTFQQVRADVISRSIAAASPLYIELSADGDTDDLQLQLDAGADAGLAVLRVE